MDVHAHAHTHIYRKDVEWEALPIQCLFATAVSFCLFFFFIIEKLEVLGC